MAIDTRAKRQAAAALCDFICTPEPLDTASWTWFNRGAAGYTYLPASPSPPAPSYIFRPKQGVGR